jgi:hypothetical protein
MVMGTPIPWVPTRWSWNRILEVLTEAGARAGGGLTDVVVDVDDVGVLPS